MASAQPLTRRSLLARFGLGAAGVAMVATLPAEVLRVDGQDVVPELDPTGRMIPVTPDNLLTTNPPQAGFGDLMGKELAGWYVISHSISASRGECVTMDLKLICTGGPIADAQRQWSQIDAAMEEFRLSRMPA